MSKRYIYDVQSFNQHLVFPFQKLTCMKKTNSIREFQTAPALWHPCCKCKNMKMPSQEGSRWKHVGGTDHFKVTGSEWKFWGGQVRVRLKSLLMLGLLTCLSESAAVSCSIYTHLSTGQFQSQMCKYMSQRPGCVLLSVHELASLTLKVYHFKFVCFFSCLVRAERQGTSPWFTLYCFRKCFQKHFKGHK